jgi:hypothetical protein
MEITNVKITNRDLETIKKGIQDKVKFAAFNKKYDIEVVDEGYSYFLQFQVSTNEDDFFTVRREEIDVFICFDCQPKNDGIKCEIFVNEKEYKEFIDYVEYLLNT